MKIKIFLSLLGCLCFLQSKTQIIAGDSVSGNIIYSNIPDTTVGSGTYLDLDNDGMNDVELWGTSMYSGGTMYGDEYIRSTRNAVELVEHASYVDSIQNATIIDNNRSWGTSTTYFYLQDYAYGLANFSHGDFYGSNKFIGFRIITTNDTLYGWILIKGTAGVVTIKSFAITKSTVGIDNVINKNEQIISYPNPASTKLYVEKLKPSAEILEIRIINVLGKEYKIIDSREQRIQLDVSDFPEGIYFVSIRTGEGVLTKKIVVQH